MRPGCLAIRCQMVEDFTHFKPDLPDLMVDSYLLTFLRISYGRILSRIDGNVNMERSMVMRS
jgi:hypothetical protein